MRKKKKKINLCMSPAQKFRSHTNIILFRSPQNSSLRISGSYVYFLGQKDRLCLNLLTCVKILYSFSSSFIGSHLGIMYKVLHSENKRSGVSFSSVTQEILSDNISLTIILAELLYI